ncbi:hypothetical protein [Kurthia sibirica]|uniref:hypothetical protein n=1 Tax=Kurthia sibirica TaxID=202750 RepID=UPI00116FFDC7|nr:hypothetical protein [Kurthia sibirica]GEK35439.1 hypothetical protein KSI01_29720 [Kurthia sibirica]
MAIVNVDLDLNIDEAAVEKLLKGMLEDYARPKILFWDIDDLAEVTRMSKSSLEKHILKNPRMKVIQRSINERGKRIWPAAEAAIVVKEIIMKEW